MKPIVARLTETLAVMTLLVGCGGGSQGGSPQGPRPPTAMAESTLVAAQTCSDLQTYLQDTAVLQMREMIEGYGPWYMEGDKAGGGPANAANPGAATPTTNPDYSQTNTQVAGVDEADFVKTDGNRVFFLSGRRLLVLASWPAASTAIESETTIEGWPVEMFLDGSKLVVFSRVPQFVFDPTVPPPTTAPVDYYYGYWYGDATKVAVYDVTTNTPALLNTWYLAGYYTSSRRIGSVVRIVLGGQLHWPQLQYWPGTWDSDPVQRQLALEALAADNERIIRGWTLSQWLARSYFVENGQTTEVPVDCTHYYKPTAPSRLGLTIVATLDYAQAAPAIDQTAVISEVGQTYANQDSLYIAAPNWWWGWWWYGGSGTGDQTFLHKFSLAQSDQVTYKGSGTVGGHILDQFSMDEYDGYLRVATTTWNGWSSSTGMQTDNRVLVLNEGADHKLHVIGSTDTLASGEQIYSSRFSGDKGFVVTYRQVDPLFTLDLSDPTLPRVVGELQIPGYSSYIHLLDATHLLTIGEDTITDQNREVRNGVVLQLFDVSDMAHPALTAKTIVGSKYSYSDAMWDHKAFNYFPKTGVLAIPFADWNPSGGTNYWGSFVSALKVYQIDASGSVTPLGQVDHSDLYTQWNQCDWYWWYMPYVRRSVQIEDYVFSFSDAGIKVNQTSDLTTPVQVVGLAPQASSSTGGACAAAGSGTK